MKHARCLEAGEQLAVLVADIDDFKAHNDEYGHLHGDESLRRVARALIQLTRSGDIAGRIGETSLHWLCRTRAAPISRRSPNG